MTESTQKPYARRKRIFSERTLSSEELVRRKAKEEVFHKRCQTVY